MDFVFKQPTATGSCGVQIAFKDKRDYLKQIRTAQQNTLGTFHTYVDELVTLEMANIALVRPGAYNG